MTALVFLSGVLAGTLIAAVALLQWIDRRRERTAGEGFDNPEIGLVDLRDIIETAARETH